MPRTTLAQRDHQHKPQKFSPKWVQVSGRRSRFPTRTPAASTPFKCADSLAQSKLWLCVVLCTEIRSKSVRCGPCARSSGNAPSGLCLATLQESIFLSPPQSRSPYSACCKVLVGMTSECYQHSWLAYADCPTVSSSIPSDDHGYLGLYSRCRR